MKNRKIIMGLGMIAVMTAVATGCSQKNAATVGTEGTTTVAESTMSEEEKKLSDYKTYGMQKDPVKGIVELVKNYQYAKVNADARRMYLEEAMRTGFPTYRLSLVRKPRYMRNLMIPSLM